MPRYVAFVGVAVVVAVGLVGLSRLSQSAVHPRRSGEDDAALPVVHESSLPVGALLLNVILTQGVLTVIVVGTAVLADVPWSAIGLGNADVSGWAVGVGVGFGLGLYVVDEVLTVVARRGGLVPDEVFRESLTPSNVGGWVVLFGAVLPLVAIAEELLFRGALIGVSTVGVAVPGWVAVVGSSLLFGAAHGAQGYGGVVVAGVLGIGLGVGYVVSGSLVTVVVAHYVVNALEFVVHERRGMTL